MLEEGEKVPVEMPDEKSEKNGLDRFVTVIEPWFFQTIKAS